MLCSELLSSFRSAQCCLDPLRMSFAALEVHGLEADTTSAQHSYLDLSEEQLQQNCVGAKRSRETRKPSSSCDQTQHDMVDTLLQPVSMARSPRAPQGRREWAHKSMAET